MNLCSIHHMQGSLVAHRKQSEKASLMQR